MRRRLTYSLFDALDKGSGSLSPDALKAVCRYARSQAPDGCSFINRAAKSDLYYTMFGWTVSYVLGIGIRVSQRRRLLHKTNPAALDEMHLTAFLLLKQLHRLMMLPKGMGNLLLKIMSPDAVLLDFLSGYRGHGSGGGTNAWALSLVLDNDEKAGECIKRMQDPSGGFLSNSGAAIPDMLSTAAALFALKCSGISPMFSPMEFIEAHWQDNGSFMDNLADGAADIEYLFYGLLALGSANIKICRK